MESIDLTTVDEVMLVAELKRRGWQSGLFTTQTSLHMLTALLPATVLVKPIPAFEPQLDLPEGSA